MGQDVVGRHAGNQPTRALHGETLRRLLDVNGPRAWEVSVDEGIDYNLTDRARGIVRQRELNAAGEVDRPLFDARFYEVEQHLHRCRDRLMSSVCPRARLTSTCCSGGNGRHSVPSLRVASPLALA